MPRQIDWRSAEVHDGDLTVDVDGDVPRGGGKGEGQDGALPVEVEGDVPGGGGRRRAAVVDRLDRGTIAEVKFRKRTITVRDVTPGSEGTVRHLLDAAVLQVGADLPVDEAA